MARLPIVAVVRGIVTSPGRRPLGAVLLLLGAAVLGGCATTPIPNDPVTSACSIQGAEFAGWFETASVNNGIVSLNGIAKPADSLHFPDTPNCSFYKWSEQMFLWLTSPAPPTYGGGGLIFQSPVFYDVSPLDANFDRTLIPHTPGIFNNLSLRAAQVGRHGLQIVRDKRGRALDVEPPRLGPTGRQLILNKAGEPVEIGRSTLGANGQPIFQDTAGRTIDSARPLIRPELDPALTVQKFVVDQKPVFLSSSGSVVELENGQADGSVLMAQNGSLVYYSITVNDVYAYFLTGVKNGQLPAANQFPTTQAQISQLTAWASTSSRPINIPDPEAMAVEVKMSWVEVNNLLNPSRYITVMATIPTYTQTPTVWTPIPNGQKTVRMALVGVHVVGFTAGNPGHPEGIWSTFENVGNAPSVTYSYLSTSSTSGGVKMMAPDFSQAWLFCAANPPPGALFNEPHMQQDPTTGEIKAIGSFMVGPSNTMRVEAWGGAANASPNPVHLPSPPVATAASARSNSEIISVNNSVRGLLNGTDVRRNYLLTGATWTIKGGATSPIENFGNPGNPGAGIGKAVGTSQMANTTMETYQQGAFSLPPFTSSFSKFGNNCFFCHDTNTTQVSHIFFTPGHPGRGTKQLFP